MTDQTTPAIASQPNLAPIAGRLTRLLGKLKRFKGAIAAIAGAGAILGGLAGYWNAYQTAKVAALPASTTTAPTGVRDLSILVLPFANQTGDAQKAYIADALTSSITSDLSRIRDAFIVPLATAFAYKDKTASVQQIGKDAGVRFVLQGSVLGSGEKLRISAQLADTQSGAQIWTQSFDGELTNLFALQDQVTTRIGNSLGREMVIVSAREAETRKSSPRAADLMLRARASLLQPQSATSSEATEALYRQALVLEPEHAGAMVGLARVLTYKAAAGYVTDAVQMEKTYEEGRALALKAKRIDPDNPTIYQTLGVYAIYHDDFAGARSAAEISLQLQPKNLGSLHNLAMSFLYGGEPAKAIELNDKTMTLVDPSQYGSGLLGAQGWAYFMLGDNDTAIQWLLKAQAKAPDSPWPYVHLAMAYADKGDEGKAREAAANLRRVAPGFRYSLTEKPQPSYPNAYKQYWEKKVLPALRKAGLPE